MLSLVVPCYNEEDNVEDFYNQTVYAFDSKIKDFEIVFVDDGSSDKTLDKLKKLYDRDNFIFRCFHSAEISAKRLLFMQD